jgi:integrase
MVRAGCWSVSVRRLPAGQRFRYRAHRADVIRVLAGHVDIRTTQIYVDVTDKRKADGIAALERVPHPLTG